MSEKQKERVELIVVFLLTIVIRVVTAFFTGEIFHPQVFEYEELAHNILQGNGNVRLCEKSNFQNSV